MIPNNTKVKSKDGTWEGMVVGVASIPHFGVGTSYIIKVTNGFIPTEVYPYEYMVITENLMDTNIITENTNE